MSEAPAVRQPAQPLRKSASLGTIFRYALGEGGLSICMNGMSNFGMIYLTQILGLSPAWAAFSISIATFYDAITDPLMGHLSDNTRTRWGRRHPYILLGGVFSALSFFAFWTLPPLLGGPIAIFVAVLFINLLIRTATTIFFVPYAALGFEICPEYESRARLQGIRFFVSQVVNFTFGALAWSMFFQDRVAPDGTRTDGSLIASNYIFMAAVLATFVAMLISLSCFGTTRYAVDNRGDKVHGNSLRAFWGDFISIFKDRLAVHVFVFFIVAQFSMMLMGTMQMFTYIFYMEFSPGEKTFAHGGGMLAFAFASLSLSRVVKRFDKKPAGYLGIALAIFGGLGLFVVFGGGLLKPGHEVLLFGWTFSVATIAFAVLQMCWWGGCGLVVPLASSMVADVAAIAEARTGELRNASYAAVFSFSTKAAGSLGHLICGFLVSAAGIVSGASKQPPEAAYNIAMMTFLAGPVVILCSLLLLRTYPVNRETMRAIEKD
jgi:GPH family glycoside/pentoside/hexuronide:cation symporter